MNLLPQSLLSKLTVPVGYRAEISDYAYLNVLSVVMKDIAVNDITVAQRDEIVRM